MLWPKSVEIQLMVAKHVATVLAFHISPSLSRIFSWPAVFAENALKRQLRLIYTKALLRVTSSSQKTANFISWGV